jgi:hypothetical protein
LLLSVLASFSELCEVVAITMLVIVETRATAAAVELLLETARFRRIGVCEAAVFYVLSLLDAWAVLYAFSEP